MRVVILRGGFQLHPFRTDQRAGLSARCLMPGGEPGTLVGPEGMQLEAAAQYYNSHLVNPKKSKMTITLVGHAPVRWKDALQLELTAATGMKRQVYFDPETHLIV